MKTPGLSKPQGHEMTVERLLERLSGRKKGPDTEEKRLVRSISEHLLRIMNTKQGSVPIDVNFGAPDMTVLPGNFSTPETERIEKSLKKTIEACEPRLNDVAVAFSGGLRDQLSLIFSISGVALCKDREIPVHMLTQMGSENTFDITLTE